MRNDRTFHYCCALYVTCKIDMITTYFWPPIRFFASHALKDDLTQVGKISSHSTLQINYLFSQLWKPLHRLLVSFGTLGVKRPIFARFADIFSSRAISELFSTASASAITFILKAIVYEERRAFGMMRKITVTKEILDWNVCQVTVTVAVFLQSRSSIYIFTDSLFFLLCLFSFVSCCVHEAISQFFPWGSLTQMAGYNQEFRTRLIADGFAFSFG